MILFAKGIDITYNYSMKENVKKERIEWDKRKIILFSLIVFFLLFAGFGIKNLFLDNNTANTSNSSPFVKENVKGVSIINSEGANIKNTVQEKIDSLKKQATEINITEIATSSPQVQKLINDLKALQSYPQSGLKDACFKICSGL